MIKRDLKEFGGLFLGVLGVPVAFVDVGADPADSLIAIEIRATRETVVIKSLRVKNRLKELAMDNNISITSDR